MTRGAFARRHAELLAFAGLSVAWLAVRLFAASRVGFGDSEALYASYALHPQPAYLDHPGLVGALARLLGHGAAPTPEAAHRFTSVAATLVPWAMLLACRACGASWRRAAIAGILTALAPEMAIGLFALTPDLLLAYAWIGALAFAALALRRGPGSAVASLGFAAAGLLAGVAAASKVTGVLLILALAAAYLSPAARAHAKTIAPWAGLAVALVVIAPIASFEASSGWPLLTHRLVDTQHDAGLSLRNAAALAGGQLAYLSPGLAILAVAAVPRLLRGRHDATGTLLFAATVIPAGALVPLCLWSRVAEPHWLAPAWLALVPAAARDPEAPSARALATSGAIALAMVAAVYAWVLVPGAVALTPATWNPRLDITSELYGWPSVLQAVERETLELSSADSSAPTPDELVVVGPHWVVCAQLEAGLGGSTRVGCDTPRRDDFDGWWPRDRWRNADVVVWVSDAHFGPPPDLPAHTLLRSREVPIVRAGRLVRLFTISVLVRGGLATRPWLEAPRLARARDRRPLRDSASSAACRRRRSSWRPRTSRGLAPRA
jgi:hypothetical protein